MFTGIITDIGRLKSRAGNVLTITAPNTVPELKAGDSISVNGICLTVVNKDSANFSVNLLEETVEKTNIGKSKAGDPINLELALKVGDRLGGHVVTGHVDCTGKLLRKYNKRNDIVMEIAVPAIISKKLAQKGSIAINGVSLTIVNISGNRFAVHLIPYTLEHTNLGQCRIGSLLNIETDRYMRND